MTYTTSGTYFDTITNDSGCIEILTIDVVILESSIAPQSINTPGGGTFFTYGAPIQLWVQGGQLGTNAQWEWYSQGCGAVAEGTGSSITVTPGGPITYFVRAEGVCDTTDCASVFIIVEGISEIPFNKEIYVYPNPSDGVFTIEAVTARGFEIELYNFLGQLLLTDSSRDEIHLIDIQEYPKGLYLLKIKGNSVNVIEKIVVQ